MVVKTRKQGNLIVLSVPKEMNIALNKEFEIFQWYGRCIPNYFKRYVWKT
jgi:hypothetical protein